MAYETFEEICGERFDLRDVISRYEDIEDPEDFEGDDDEKEIAEERAAIENFIAQVKGYGGDEQWRGDWYPVSFIHRESFVEYAEELAEDIGAVNRDASWPNYHIDWESAASDLEQDYSSVYIDQEEYLYR